MSNDSSQGGSPHDPSHGNVGPGGAEDGYPTEPIPQQPYPPQPAQQQGQPGYPQQGQQGQPGQGYGQPPQQGYGQPQQGHGQQPQYGMGYPPQGQGYPQQGQPQQRQPYAQQGQGGQPPQGWAQQGYAPSYGEPPKKSRAGLIVFIIIAVIALIIIAGAVWAIVAWRSTDAEPQPTVVTTAAATPTEEPTPGPTDDATRDPIDEPTVTPTTPKDPATKPVEPPVSDDPPPPAAEGQPPVMPDTVGEFTAAMDSEPEFGAWVSPSGGNFNAAWTDLLPREGFEAQMQDPQTFGDWTCAPLGGNEISQCVSEIHDGTVLLTGTGTPEEAASFGEQLRAAWK